ncbi:Hypothetical protein NTJ_01884 [Nesidiocoris tenuis]|uniref:Secreted protein n=1 Tax=Nesidiocoris tenuis TaxID=355587 RepID=A0ABN7A9U8_9HEMI|nr:Hypothetical protein NTJ_01884 [Nesidiocoris tenuis]
MEQSLEMTLLVSFLVILKRDLLSVYCSVVLLLHLLGSTVEDLEDGGLLLSVVLLFPSSPSSSVVLSRL